MIHRAALVGLSVLALFLVQRCIEFKRAVHAVQNHPGLRTLLNTLGPVENFFPRIPGVTPGSFHMWQRKHRDFEAYGWDVITYVAAFFGSRTNFYVADADAIREITTYRARFPKPIEQYALLRFFGDNIVASEGDEWKRFRKIAAPAFSERNNKLVWDETLLIMQDLFDNVWGSKQEVEVGHAVDLILPIALNVIGAAGFGRRMSWKEDEVIPYDHTMSFKHALHAVSMNVFNKLVTPNWLLDSGIIQCFRNIKQAFSELESYMLEMIQIRRGAEKRVERYDLFSSLLDANEVPEEGQIALTDRELIGNMFIFLLAGHETTAHSLCYVFAMLALYPQEQETLYQQAQSVCRDGRLPGYEDFNSLNYFMAVLNETLRMFPPVHSIPKSVAEDTTITVTNAAGERTTIPMPRGSSISMHIPGLHYNPRYWQDPHTFRPSRFLSPTWPRDAFMPFSAGPRACLGRKFSETESVAIMAMLILRYRIDIMDEPQFRDETREQRMERVLRSKPGVTMTPLRVPLVFKRR